MSRFKILFNDILEMISRIETSVKKIGINFRNTTFYDSTLMRLQVIGEAIKKLPRDTLEKYSEVDWNVFVKFREVVSHNYFKINYKILNDMIVNELPRLKMVIKDMNRRID